MIKQDIHSFRGMRQDTHPIKQPADFLWEAHNIDFTTKDDNTLLTLTNERGTKDLQLTLNSIYIGHCIVGKYLIVFAGDGNGNQIYRLTNSNGEWLWNILYSGDLGMLPEYPLQTLGIYEGPLVQKVYWVDGKNPPRCINITADKLFPNKTTLNELYPEGCFDFTPELALNEEVTITREEGGEFPAGVVQYAFSYYNKYGQETNLFYTTELLYTSFTERGGSPEEKVSNSFHININNLEFERFDYIRIYSIFRTSLNATPMVKIVGEIPIEHNSYITFVDTGNIGDNIDPTKMLYIGGEYLIASTIAEKDNTLFLGNISKVQKDSSTYKDFTTAAAAISIYNTVNSSTREVGIDLNVGNNTFYNYVNTLSSGNITTFKVGDYYRLGVQFQYKTGEWSEPVFIKDYQIPTTSRPSIKTTGNPSLILPKIEMTFKESPSESSLKAGNSLKDFKDLGYKKIRPVVVLPSVYDRQVVAQGVLCPTVFSIGQRKTNTPFSQSSWFFRPMSLEDPKITNTTNLDKGSVVSFKHLDCLLANDDRGAEIQNMFYDTFENANTAARYNYTSRDNLFFVDQSILTFHSPDIEFDDSTRQAIEGSQFDLKIVGLIPIKCNAGDISIQTSSTVPAPDDDGFYHRTFLSTDYSNRILAAGMFYKSHIIDDAQENSSDIYVYKPKETKWELNWLIYPWHRNGSLNNDFTRPTGSGTRTAMLKRKVISNIRIAEDNIWLDTIWAPAMGITPTSIFNSNEVSLVKIPSPLNSGITTLNYYGNVDTLLTSDQKYSFYLIPNTGENINLKDGGGGIVEDAFTHCPLQQISGNLNYSEIGDSAEYLKVSTEPVRMKYKSSPHAVFALNYRDNKANEFLPYITTSANNELKINDYTGKNIEPFWLGVNIPQKTAINAIASGVYTREGTDAVIQEEVTKWLNYNYSVVKAGDFAICTCGIAGDSLNYADLYITTAEKTWKYVAITEDMADTYYRYGNEFWKVVITKDGVRGHLERFTEAIYQFEQNAIVQSDIDLNKPYLFLAELVKPNTPPNQFGGSDYTSNLWIPAGKAVNLPSTADATTTIEYIYGDTFYQRYDCLKTMSFTNEDENSVIDILSFMCESRVNIDGRYDKNRGQLSNLNMSSTNFNLINPVYSQRNNFYNYRILDEKYHKSKEYPSQIAWSLEKKYLEDIDTWTNINLANSIDLDGSAGPITSLETFNDLLIAFQEKSLSQILFNSRVQIPTSEGVPIEISNNYKVEGVRTISDTVGCQDKATIAKSLYGLYFIDSTTDTLYLYNGQLQDISTKAGFNFWMKKYHTDDLWNMESDSTGIRASYDPNRRRLYLSSLKDTSNENTLCYSEQLEAVESLMSYSNVVMFPMDNNFFSLTKICQLWQNYEGEYNKFYGEYKMPWFTYICNDNPFVTKVFDTIEYQADVDIIDTKKSAYVWKNNKSFDWIRAYNEYQDSDKKILTQLRKISGNISLRNKFRMWRGQIPRQGRERIRNPWAAITLGFNDPDDKNPSDFKLRLHNISTKYTI